MYLPDLYSAHMEAELVTLFMEFELVGEWTLLTRAGRISC